MSPWLKDSGRTHLVWQIKETLFFPLLVTPFFAGLFNWRRMKKKNPPTGFGYLTCFLLDISLFFFLTPDKRKTLVTQREKKKTSSSSKSEYRHGQQLWGPPSMEWQWFRRPDRYVTAVDICIHIHQELWWNCARRHRYNNSKLLRAHAIVDVGICTYFLFVDFAIDRGPSWLIECLFDWFWLVKTRWQSQ